MNSNDIIRMAREAGFTRGEQGTWRCIFAQMSEAFSLAYAAGAAAEREECAKVCEEELCGCCWESDARAAAEQLAAAIRARGQG